MTAAFEKCLALIFSLMILGQAYWVRRYIGTWLFPACIFGLFWFGFTFFPLAVLFWVPVRWYAIGFIFLCTVAFSLGSVPFDWRRAFERNKEKGETTALAYGTPFLKTSFYMLTFASLMFVILDSLAQGISLHDMFFDLIGSAAVYRDMASFDTMDVTIFERLGSLCAYVSPTLGGFLFSRSSTKNERRRVVFLSFLPPAFIAIAHSTKWTLFLSIVFFYAALLMHRVSVAKLHLFGTVSVRFLAVCVAALLAITSISFLSRGMSDADDSDFVRNRLVFYFASYSCAHIYGFSDWFSFVAGGHSEVSYTHEDTTYGYYTFASLFRMLGSHKAVAQGADSDYYSYEDLLYGNIYTIFRGLITDFGFIGSVLFMLGSGILFHWAFHAMLRNVKPVFTVAVFVFGMGYYFTSFATSMLSTSGTYLSFALLWIVLGINKWITQRDGRRLTMAVEVPAQP
jgi:oligosaccharide repeat unit polymerase